MTCSSFLEKKLEIINFISNQSEVHFKSQQQGDPELSISDKKLIVESILNKSISLFLSRFGQFLNYDQIIYLKEICTNDEDLYSINYFLNFKKKEKSKTNSKIIKNRRFEAMKQLMEEGSYFSESEMKSRNPLLYEHLVGQYLTPDEKEEVNRINTSNTTFVKILLQQIDKDNEETFKQKQLENEEKFNVNDNTKSRDIRIQEAFNQDDIEYDTSDDEDSDGDGENQGQREKHSSRTEEVIQTDNYVQNSNQLWGEELSDQPLSTPVGIDRAPYATPSGSKYIEHQITARSSVPISDDERSLLFEEFRTHIFTNFLEGKEENFDYSNVDSNPVYDNIEVNTQEAEEKYFDGSSESESISCSSDMQVDCEDSKKETSDMQVDSEGNKKEKSNEDSEDELDIFMSNLKPELVVQDINSRIKQM